MSFVILGLLCIMLGAVFFRISLRKHDKEGKYGSIGLMVSGLILALFFGVFYRLIVLFS